MRRIQKSISWPMQNKLPSGMNENEFIPKIVNPRAKRRPLSFLWKSKDRFDVPHVKLKIESGDLVIFDQRLMHCVESTYPKVTRRLMTFLISKNAFDLASEHELLEKYTREEIMVDLLDLIVNERNHIGCPPWGSEFERNCITDTTHYIKISKSLGSALYDTSKIKLADGSTFTSVVDFEKYASIGKKYREGFEGANKNVVDVLAQEFGYKDVHLGINSQNIK